MQTCRRIHDVLEQDYLWRQLANDNIWTISPLKNPLNMSASALRAEAVRALKLEANWREKTPVLREYVRVRHDMEEGAYDEMDLLSEGKMLVTARRMGRGDSPFFLISVFTLGGGDAHEALRIKVQGTLIHHAVSLSQDGLAIMVANTILLGDERCALCVHDDG